MAEYQERPERSRAQPPQKPKKKRRRRRLGAWGALLYVVLVIGVSVLLACFAWTCATDVLALNKPQTEATITLTPDLFTTSVREGEDGEEVEVTQADVKAVAEQLKEHGLIQYPWLFRLFTTVTHKASSIVPGTYTLNTTMDYSAIVHSMSKRSSARAEVSVVIPEGATSEQIFALLEENGVCSAADLRETAANYDFRFSFLQNVIPLGSSNRLEGYLFPDTYLFYQNMDPVQALNKMLLRFDEIFTDKLREQVSAEGRTIHEIVTIASLIEKETAGDDQVLISGVIYNRLYAPTSETAGYLNIDATIQYLLPQRKEQLTREDLAIDSPYNTYLYTGLPPGPIAAPGQASIRAAMNPDTADGYYYYALGDDGAHHFFYSLSELESFRASQELYQNGT